MNSPHQLPTLLSPAGSMNALYAAINGGCDAVYLGGKSFSARMSADNFTDEDITNVIDHCHLHGVKIYIAVNTLYKDAEIKPLFKFLEFAYKNGADAFIFQDIGTAVLARSFFPEIEIHASTQMNTHSLACARFLKGAGFSRLILSRELSLSQIANISQNSGAETEVFAHGALCASFSGQCLMSSFGGGRSGNRGRCAQPCRLKYSLYDSRGKSLKDGYLLSPKDIMTLDSLADIAASGISTLKIEGRMKNPEYVHIATSIYRKYLDMAGELHSVDKNDVDKLLQVFNRGGSFSGGYINQHSGLNMMSFETPKNTGVFIGTVTGYEPKFKRIFIKTEKELIPGDGLEIWTQTEPHIGFGVNSHTAAGETAIFTAQGNISEGDKVYRTFDKRLADELKNAGTPGYSGGKKIEVTASVSAKINEPIGIRLSYNGIITKVQGAVVQSAQNAPLPAEQLLAQINKPDTYPLNIKFTDCDIDDNIYMPISAVNKVRREVIEQFASELINSHKRHMISIAPLTKPCARFSEWSNMVEFKERNNTQNSSADKKISVSVTTKSQLSACLATGIDRIYADISNLTLEELNSFTEQAHKYGTALFAALPRIDIDDDFETIRDSLENTNIDGYLIRTYGQLYLLSGSKKIKVLDSSFNVFNSLSAEYLLEFADIITPSLELSLEELGCFANEKTEAIVHGRQTLMITRQCPIGLYVAGKNASLFCKLRGNSEGYTLKDDKGSEFPIVTHCAKCFTSILSSRALFMLGKTDDLNKLNAGSLRLDFTTETAEEAQRITECYIKALSGNNDDTEVLGTIERYIETGIGDADHLYKGIF